MNGKEMIQKQEDNLLTFVIYCGFGYCSKAEPTTNSRWIVTLTDD